MKEKKTIKGVKKTTQNYTGKVVNVVKKIIAVALLMGIMLTAAQAIRMFKHWYESRTNDVGVEDVQKQENVTFEDVKTLIEEYRAAIENNDVEEVKALESKLSKGNYFETLNEEFKEQVVESLGYDSQKVKIVTARDGVFLVDKKKAEKNMIFDHTGQINASVKYIDKNGKNPIIPQEIKTMVEAIGRDVSFARFRSLKDLERHYSNFEYVEDYVVELDDIER